MRKLLAKVLIVFLILTSKSFAFEKVGTTSFQFLKVITSARAAAMGGAYSAIAFSSDAIFWNPAGLTQIKNFALGFGYLDWFMDVQHYSFSAAYTIDGIGTFGVLGMGTSVGDIPVTTVSQLGFVDGVYNPGLTGESFSPSSSVFGISFARQLNDKFSFGLTVKYAREDLIYESAEAIIFDGGLRFDTKFKSIVIAATLRHFGPEIKFVDESYPLPQTLNIGISAYLFSDDDPLLMTVKSHKLLLAYDIIQPRDFDQQHNVGMEYGYEGLVYIRGGYVFNSDQEGLNAGIGVDYRGYRVDYAYSEHGTYLGSVHRVSVSYSIN
ncbi:MAG: PorV/PorQ family protein [Melioribacteraceae bacterium]|nr:PorV/PorQ family protein [Melioribacteraceae bacterium]